MYADDTIPFVLVFTQKYAWSVRHVKMWMTTVCGVRFYSCDFWGVDFNAKKRQTEIPFCVPNLSLGISKTYIVELKMCTLKSDDCSEGMWYHCIADTVGKYAVTGR